MRLCVLFLLWGLLYLPLYPDLFRTWVEDSNNSHGMLVPFVSGYIVWGLRKRLARESPACSVTGLSCLIVSLCLYVIGYAGGIVFLSRLTLVTTLIGLILYNCGWGVMKLLRFPLLFLFFLLPLPDTILSLVAFPLQLFVSDLATRLLDMTGIPVYREGNLLFFARYSFEVTEACSGIRSLVSFFALGTVCAYLTGGSWVRKGILVLSTIPLALGVNLVRVVGTGLLANYYGNQVAQGFLHDFSGFFVFSAGTVMLVSLEWVLRHLPFFQKGSPSRGTI